MVLFNNKGFIRNSKKADLAKHILDEHQFDDVIPNIGKWRYVLDGGTLLQYSLTSWFYVQIKARLLCMSTLWVTTLTSSLLDTLVAIQRTSVIENEAQLNQIKSTSH